MKSNILKLWMLISMLWPSISASAYDFEADGIYYNILSLDDLTCEVTYNTDNKSTKDLLFRQYRGNSSGNYSLDFSYPSYSGTVTIPSKVNYKGRELSVTGIGEYAFLGCTELKSLSLPSTINQIEEILVNSHTETYAGAFDYCSIETFTSGNAYTLDIFNQTYATYSGYQTKDNLRNLVLSNDFSGVIGVDFSDYLKLVSIQSNSATIPTFTEDPHFSNNQFLNLLIKVPSSAFDSYRSCNIWSNFWDIVTLEDPQMPPTELKSYDFENEGFYYNILSLEDLTCEVTYNTDNKSTKDLLFRQYRGNGSGNYSLDFSYPSYSGTVTIPSKVNYKGRELSVTGIGEYAFLGCTELKSLSLPSTINQIEEILVNSHTETYAGAFDYCSIETFTSGNAYTLDIFNQTYATYSGYQTKDNLRNLVLANDFSGVIGVDFSDYEKLTSIRSNSASIPLFSDGEHFSKSQFINTEVFVPEDSFSAYQSSDIWKDFWDLKAMKSVESITLNETQLNLEPYETLQLVATVLPEDAYDTSVFWISSNPSIASVDSNGLVTAITKGDAVITAFSTDGSDIAAECVVHVDLLVKEIILSETEIGLEPEGTKKLEVTVEPNNAYVKDVIWSSEAEDIASVDQNGVVTAKNIGVTNIVVQTTDGSNLMSTCKVTVAELVKSIIVMPKEATINEDEVLQLNCLVSPESATYKNVIWESEDNDIATVDANGMVTAISAGTTIIKANACDGSNVFGECNITVNAETKEYQGICYQRNSPYTLKIVTNMENPYSGDFFIPETVNFNGQEMLVTEIGIGAFAECDDLNRIVIPKSISKIGENAFKGCSNLVSVKLCDGSSLSDNFDTLFPDSPIDELYIGSNGISYDPESRILSIVKGMTLGNNVMTFPPQEVFNSLEYFIVEDGDMAISEPEDYCSSSMSLINQQNIQDSNTHIYYRFFYLVTYAHLSPILNALQNSTLNYLHIGREVQQVEADTSMTQEIIPTTAGDRYQEFGYKDEVNYQYQEIIVKSDYNRHPVESISINESIMELNIGESKMLSAVCLPTNASLTAVEWSSSNEEVAIVDIFGKVTKLTDGEAVVTATTTDGTNLSSTCKIVNIGDGVETIVEPSDNDIYSIYNLQGMKILESEDIDKVKQLPSGVYIVNGKKLIIK